MNASISLMKRCPCKRCQKEAEEMEKEAEESEKELLKHFGKLMDKKLETSFKDDSPRVEKL